MGANSKMSTQNAAVEVPDINSVDLGSFEEVRKSINLMMFIRHRKKPGKASAIECNFQIVYSRL